MTPWLSFSSQWVRRGEHQEAFRMALGIEDSGKFAPGIAAVEIALDHMLDDGPEEAICGGFLLMPGAPTAFAFQLFHSVYSAPWNHPDKAPDILENILWHSFYYRFSDVLPLNICKKYAFP